jgi:hypothetical protein
MGWLFLGYMGGMVFLLYMVGSRPKFKERRVAELRQRLRQAEAHRAIAYTEGLDPASCPVCGQGGGFHQDAPSEGFRGHLEARAAIPAELVKPKGWQTA